jgi:hypothetical protein
VRNEPRWQSLSVDHVSELDNHGAFFFAMPMGDLPLCNPTGAFH